jgi:hypothetical protein
VSGCSRMSAGGRLGVCEQCDGGEAGRGARLMAVDTGYRHPGR